MPSRPSRTVYLDWNATTPPHPEVLAAMRAAAERGWANPSSVHAHGRAARAIVEDARAAVASLVGADARDLVFTAGGTEANNLALRSAGTMACAIPNQATTPGAKEAERVTILTSRLEHPSVTRVAEALEREGKATVRWLSVLPAGVIDLEDLSFALASIEPGAPALVTIQAVNHETGIVQPVAEVITRAHAVGARVHVDAVQAWGKVEVPGGWDTASIAPHKMRGPKGIGALACREGIKVDAVLLGGAQEKGVRPGTVDATLAAGFGKAAELARTGPARYAALAEKRDQLAAALALLGAKIVGTDAGGPDDGDGTRRAPHVVSTVWPGWTGAELVAALDLEGVSVSSGAACSAGTVEPSPVLLAMLGADEAKRGLRVSMGDATTEEEIAHALGAFARVSRRA